jgi:hypothetical protein
VPGCAHGRTLRLAPLWALATGALAAACAGKAGDGASNGSTAGSSGAAGAGTGTAGTTVGGGGSGGTSQPPMSSLPPPAMFKPAPAGLRRLTLEQYKNSVADLLGPGVKVPADFEPDTSLSGFASIGASLVSLSPHLVEQLETASLALAHQALADPAGRAALVGCNPTAATDDACVTQFITKLGRRAWRRPLTAEEISIYVKLVNGVQTEMKPPSFFGGLEYGLAALFESPHFLYREELGAPQTGNTAVLAFDDHELATRLSYLLWNTTPDDALLDAADARQLTQGTGFQTQVARLLASPRLATGTRTFFSEYYRLGDLDVLPQLPSLFPQRTDTLGPAMREETQRFLAELATSGADMRSLFDSSTTFVNAELAKLYGLPGVTGTDFVKTTLPAAGLRVGYLGQGSFLALNAHSNVGSPTYRGKFIREMLMCQSVPPPPMNVPPLPETAPGAAPQTMRQKLEVHRAVQPCKSCHTLMDPIGLAYENFDAIGAYRTMDAGQLIDASGDLDGGAFKNPRELATLLHDNPRVMDCLARNLYRYATGHVETTDEEPAVLQIAQGFKDGKFQYGALVSSVVKSAGFVLAAPPAPDTSGAAGGAGGMMAGAAGVGGGGKGGSTGAAGGSPDGGVVTLPAMLSYARDIAPIIANKCSPCHTTDAKAGFNWTYDNLVTNTSVTNTTTKACTYISKPPMRVVPGDPDHSLLWTKLNLDTTQATVHGCGDQMPLPSSGKVLLTPELDAFHNWIQQGAKP